MMSIRPNKEERGKRKRGFVLTSQSAELGCVAVDDALLRQMTG